MCLAALLGVRTAGQIVMPGWLWCGRGGGSSGPPTGFASAQAVERVRGTLFAVVDLEFPGVGDRLSGALEPHNVVVGVAAVAAALAARHSAPSSRAVAAIARATGPKSRVLVARARARASPDAKMATNTRAAR
jgi:hypothetical protein